MEGRVARIEDNTLTLKLREERLIVVHLKTEETEKTEPTDQDEAPENKEKVTKTDFVANMLVVAAIRPEFVSIARTTGTRATGKLNNLQGSISKIFFSGGSVRCEVSLENGDHLMCRIPMDESAGHLNIREEVSVTLDADEILVYPYPRVGLEKEISLE